MFIPFLESFQKSTSLISSATREAFAQHKASTRFPTLQANFYPMYIICYAIRQNCRITTQKSSYMVSYRYRGRLGDMVMNIQNLAVGVLAVAVLGGIGIKAVKVLEQNNSYISVKGLADRSVVADNAVWTISVETEGNTVKEAQEKMNKDLETVTKFLKNEGIAEKEIVDINSKTHDKFYYGNSGSTDDCKVYRFNLKNSIKINTNEIQKIKVIKSKLAKLQEQGVQIGDEIKYIYTKFNELRIEMLQEAAKDSEKRAQKIAEALGAKITGLRNFASGKFSMSAEDESATSDREWSEEGSLNKRIRVVVTSSFNMKTK